MAGINQALSFTKFANAIAKYPNSVSRTRFRVKDFQSLRSYSTEPITVGVIGGVAIAYATSDILRNVLNGLSMQLSKPFSLGDTIKAGIIEGQVIEMGLTKTVLLNAERFPVTVANSVLSNQISDDIKSMLRSNAKTFMEKEAPYCFISRVENHYAELTIGYNLQRMSKDELYSTQQDILLQAAQIIKKHDGTLGNTTDLSCQ